MNSRSAFQRTPVRKGITFGTFDLLHVGHVSILERARALCDYLMVGVSTDELTFAKKSVEPVYSLPERMRIVRSLRAVDFVFVEESLERKAEYIREFDASLLVMGDDWEGRFDHLRDLCDVVYLPRTRDVSTTLVRAGVVARSAR